MYADEDRTVLLGQTPFVYQAPAHPLKKLILALPGYGVRHIILDWTDSSPIAVKLKPTPPRAPKPRPTKPAKPAPSPYPESKMNPRLAVKASRVEASLKKPRR